MILLSETALLIYGNDLQCSQPSLMESTEDKNHVQALMQAEYQKATVFYECVLPEPTIYKKQIPELQ